MSHDVVYGGNCGREQRNASSARKIAREGLKRREGRKKRGGMERETRQKGHREERAKPVKQ